MDKAEAWMSSWGWQPGHGLGKQETGIVDPLKASIKNDKLGVGSGEGRFIPWWERAYNQAAKGEKPTTPVIKLSVPLAYAGNFVRPQSAPPPTEAPHKDSATSSHTFEAFEGRRCNKASQTGKLARLKMQESKFQTEKQPNSSPEKSSANDDDHKKDTSKQPRPAVTDKLSLETLVRQSRTTAATSALKSRREACTAKRRHSQVEEAVQQEQTAQS